jgi:hypothetical protein
MKKLREEGQVDFIPVSRRGGDYENIVLPVKDKIAFVSVCKRGGHNENIVPPE